MRASTKRFYSILASIGLIVGSMYIYGSHIRPIYAEIQRLRGERLTEFSVLNDSRVTIEIVTELLRRHQGIAEIEDRLSLSLPFSEEITSLLNQIQGLAGMNNVQVNSMSFQHLPIAYGDSQSILKPVGSLRIIAQINGNYESIKAFLEGIETNVRVIDVRSLRISGGGAAANPTLSSQLIVDAYYQIPEK